MIINIAIFALGLAFGSFYNVVALRLLKNESIVFPKSHCPKCKKKLQWYELIPVLSYVFLLGKCHKCQTKISIIYPLIELLTGFLFFASYYVFGISLEFIISLIISSILVIIYITDFKEYIILDEVLLLGSILIIMTFFSYLGFVATLIKILHGLGLFVIFYLIKLLGDKLFKKESLGGGDIKLAFIIGLVLGIKLGMFSIVISSFLAFPYAIVVSLFKKVREIPFGPFLITALLIIYFKIEFFSELFTKLFVW